MKTKEMVHYLYMIVCGYLLILFPQQNLWLGDCYTTRALYESYPFLKLLSSPDGYFFISPIPAILGYMIGWFQLSYLFGIVYFIYAYKFYRIDPKYLILFSLPIIQQFAGYYEIYAPVYAFTLAGFYYWVKEDIGKLSLFTMLAFFGHFVIAAPLICLWGLTMLNERRYFTLSIAALCVLGYIGWSSYVFPSREVPLVAFSGEYWLFSWLHILEFVAIIVLSNIWGLFNLSRFKFEGFHIINKGMWQAFCKKKYHLFLTALFASFITFIIMPHMGMFKDWDLMSMATIPVAIFLLHNMNKINWKALVVGGLLTVSWILFNSREQPEVMLRYMKAMPQYTYDFRDGHILKITKFIWVNEMSNYEAAKELQENADRKKGKS